MQSDALHIAAFFSLRTACANELARSEANIERVQTLLHVLPDDHPDRLKLEAEERALSRQLEEARSAWRRLSQKGEINNAH